MLNTLIFKHAPCPTCQGVVVGRTDKIFCGLKCKNEHHRVARSLFKTRYETLKRRLIRNLIVLEGIMGEEESSLIIHKDALFKHGFDSSVNLGGYEKEGRFFFEIENYVYTQLDDGTVLVKRREGLSEMMPVFFRRWKVSFPKGLKTGKITNEMTELFARWNE